MNAIGKIFALITMLAASSCLFGMRETLADVTFEGLHLGLEYIPDRSLEGYNESYFVFVQTKDSKRKYFGKDEDGLSFSNFPVDKSILSGIPVKVVDTVARTVEKYGPETALSTLYADPAKVDAKSFASLTDFLLQSYQKPDSDNIVLSWMNHALNTYAKKDSLHYQETIYAIVYASLPMLEPEYVSADAKKSIRVCVDNTIYFKDATEPSPAWGGVGKLQDSTFFYWTGRQDEAVNFGNYTLKGRKFSERFSKTQLQN